MPYHADSRHKQSPLQMRRHRGKILKVWIFFFDYYYLFCLFGCIEVKGEHTTSHLLDTRTHMTSCQNTAWQSDATSISRSFNSRPKLPTLVKSSLGVFYHTPYTLNQLPAKLCLSPHLCKVCTRHAKDWMKEPASHPAQRRLNKQQRQQRMPSAGHLFLLCSK